MSARISSIVALAVAATIAADASAQTSRSPDRTDGMSIMAGMIEVDGTIVRSVGITNASRSTTDTGVYFVEFDHNIRGCYHAVSAVSPNEASNFPSVASSSLGSENNRQLIVTTRFGSGAPVNRSFTVLVICQ